MNFRILSKLLGVLTILIGTFMLFSLIWADPNIGSHTDAAVKATQLESKGIWALVYSALICWVLGGAMVQYGRSAGNAKIYRKEAMAIVGLSWVLASVLGAMPYTFSGTIRAARFAARRFASFMNPIQWSLPHLAGESGRPGEKPTNGKTTEIKILLV